MSRYPARSLLLGIWLTRKQASHQFRNCYDRTWGGFKDRTQPALGNHEYGDRAAIGYFEYWGTQAGPAGKGYPSYDLGDRHIVVLNDVRHPNACVLAYRHHALFSSGVSNSHALHPRLRPYSPVV
ncbi:MAG TPA: hypothetical protein VM709_10920 [Candidatus Sulfotelmatobacter sp.]|nr:hypothetical protein [Candidatus Sulfotelmatobacter sp.]